MNLLVYTLIFLSLITSLPAISMNYNETDIESSESESESDFFSPVELKTDDLIQLKFNAPSTVHLKTISIDPILNQKAKL